MREKVYLLLKKVKKGKITTYRDLASKAGIHPRAVAVYMRTNKDLKVNKCYKVIRSDGSLGGYSSKFGIKEKIRLLKKDNIKIEKNRINLDKYRHNF